MPIVQLERLSALALYFLLSLPYFTWINTVALLNFWCFKCSTYLRLALIWKFGHDKNCINHSIIIFLIKLAELTSFDFDYIRATALIQGLYWLTFFSPIQHLIGCSAYLSKRGVLYPPVMSELEGNCFLFGWTWWGRMKGYLELDSGIKINHNLP